MLVQDFELNLNSLYCCNHIVNKKERRCSLCPINLNRLQHKKVSVKVGFETGLMLKFDFHYNSIQSMLVNLLNLIQLSDFQNNQYVQDFRYYTIKTRVKIL